MRRQLGVLFIVAMLAGCAMGREASRQTVSVDAQPPPGLARVIFFRPSRSALFLRDAQISVNGRSACVLSNGDAFAYDVAPGELAIVAKNWEDLLGARSASLAVDSGKIYFVQIAAERAIPLSTWFSVTPVDGRPAAADFSYSVVNLCKAS